MSTTQNTIVLEEVVEYVRQKMDENPTIPEEAFSDLVRMEIARREE